MTLAGCVENFTRSEDLCEHIVCDACGQKCAMKKQLTITEPPKVLVLHLKRFDAIKQSKIDALVQFPLYGFTLGGKLDPLRARRPL